MAAQKVLEARNLFPENSLADLYSPITMPPQLVKAHQELNRAVELCYRPQAFTSEAKRMGACLTCMNAIRLDFRQREGEER